MTTDLPGEGAPEFPLRRRRHVVEVSDEKLVQILRLADPSIPSEAFVMAVDWDILTQCLRIGLAGSERFRRIAEHCPAAGTIIDDAGFIHDADTLLMEAWEVISNAGLQQGGWDHEVPDWVAAAERWRERWHARLDAGFGRGDVVTSGYADVTERVRMATEKATQMVSRYHDLNCATLVHGWVNKPNHPRCSCSLVGQMLNIL